MSHPPRHPLLRTVTTALPALIAGLLISSCVTPPPPAPEPPVDPNKPKPLYEWNGEGRTVSHMRINLEEQKVSVFSGDEQIGWATVATGLSSYPTPTGEFKVMEKVADKKSNLFGRTYDSDGKVVNSDARMGRDSIPEGGKFVGAQMSYFMRLTGDGVGMHAGPIPRPGHRASHGCIRMPRSFAPLVFASVPVGTPVTIARDGASNDSYTKQEPAPSSSIFSTKKKKTVEAAATSAPDARTSDAPPKSKRIRLPSTAPSRFGESQYEIRPALPVSGQ